MLLLLLLLLLLCCCCCCCAAAVAAVAAAVVVAPVVAAAAPATIPSDLLDAWRRGTLGMDTANMTWTRFRELLCSLWWIDHRNDPQFLDRRMGRGLQQHAPLPAGKEAAPRSKTYCAPLSTRPAAGGGRKHGAGAAASTRRKSTKKRGRKVRDSEDEESEEDDTADFRRKANMAPKGKHWDYELDEDEDEELPNESDGQMRLRNGGAKRHKGNKKPDAEVAKIAKKAASDVMKGVLADISQHTHHIEDTAADFHKEANKATKLAVAKAAEVEAKVDAATKRISEAEAMARKAEREAEETKKELTQLKQHNGAGAGQLRAYGLYSSHSDPSDLFPQAPADQLVPFIRGGSSAFHAYSANGAAGPPGLGAYLQGPAALPPQRPLQPSQAPPPAPYPGQAPPPAPGRQYNRPWEPRWCDNCEIETHNTVDCRSSHLPKGFIRQRREARMRGEWDESTPLPNGRGRPYRPATGAGARREQQEQQWAQRGPPAPQGAWQPFSGNAGQPPPPSWAQNAAANQPSGAGASVGDLQQQLDEMRRQRLQQQIQQEQAAIAASLQPAAAPGAAAAGVHPDRQPQVAFDTKPRMHVMQARVPSQIQASAILASRLNRLTATCDAAYLPPHQQYDRNGKGLLMMSVKLNNVLHQEMLLDSGANLSIVDASLLSRLQPPPKVRISPITLHVGHAGGSTFQLTEYCFIHVSAVEGNREHTVEILFYIRRGLSVDADSPLIILGNDSAHRLVETHNYVTGEVTLRHGFTDRALDIVVPDAFSPDTAGPAPTNLEVIAHTPVRLPEAARALNPVLQHAFLQQVANCNGNKTAIIAEHEFKGDPYGHSSSYTTAMDDAPPALSASRSALRRSAAPCAGHSRASSRHASRRRTWLPRRPPQGPPREPSARPRSRPRTRPRRSCRPLWAPSPVSGLGGGIPETAEVTPADGSPPLRPQPRYPLTIHKGKPIPPSSHRLVAVRAIIPQRLSTDPTDDGRGSTNPELAPYYKCEPLPLYSSGAQGQRNRHKGHILPVTWTAALCDQHTGRAAHRDRDRHRILYVRVFNESKETLSLYEGMVLGETVACNGLSAFSRLLDMEADYGPDLPPEEATVPSSARGCRLYTQRARPLRERYVPDMQAVCCDATRT